MTKEQVRLIVFAGQGGDIEKAQALAAHLKVDMTQIKSETDGFDLVLMLDSEGIALVSDGMVLRQDFKRMLPRLRQSRLQGEMLVRAAKIKGADYPLTVIDATAGLGEDAFLLAAAGFSVRLYEYNPVIAALLRDGLEHAASVPELEDIVRRMVLIEADSVVELPKLTVAPDVILLDPMFQERKKSGLIKKKFQLIHQLEYPCGDEVSLVQAAMALRPRKVVIKRTRKAPYLADVKPNYSLEGKVIRYDCLVFSQNTEKDNYEKGER
ncbi:MAG: class I SAM-dependent methyltransferase [Lachnospiraceae bacterium]|nr:class I SAM-dependent methyltransferase [Lachnospiraceae bacterium]